MPKLLPNFQTATPLCANCQLQLSVSNFYLERAHLGGILAKGLRRDPTHTKNVLFGFWDINQSFLVPWNLWPMKKELIKVMWDLFLAASLPYDFMAEWNKQWWLHASSASVNFRQYLSGKLGETIYELYGYGSRGKVMRISWHNLTHLFLQLYSICKRAKST